MSTTGPSDRLSNRSTSTPTASRVLIRNARVLTMDPSLGDLDHGDVFVDDGQIISVGDPIDAPAGTEIVDASGCIVIPGLVDTHRHMFEAVVRGCAPAHTLQDYFDHVLRRIAPALTPADMHHGELLSARAAMSSGVTTVQDVSNAQISPEHSDAMVAALKESHLRAVFAYGKDFVTMTAEGNALPDDVRRVRSSLLPDDDALVTMALVTEPFGDDGIPYNARLARELGLPTALHAAGAGSIGHLRDLDALLPGAVYIHGNGLTGEDLQLIADSGGNLSVAPAIEMMMGHGYPMLQDAPDGLLVSLSVDVEVTCAADMFGQMRSAYQATRSRQLADGDGPRAPITVYDVLRHATIDGATALGMAGRTGSLSPGKRADIVVLRADGVAVSPVVDPYSTVVLQMDRSNVDTVLIDGVIVKRHGVDVFDTSTSLTAAADTVERLFTAGVLERPAYPVPTR